eukprot:s194_g32.t1
MGISDPYPDQEKTLYIHFIRGGDGERCTEAIDVDKSGNVQGSLAEVQMDALVKDTQVHEGAVKSIVQRFSHPRSSSPNRIPPKKDADAVGQSLRANSAKRIVDSFSGRTRELAALGAQRFSMSPPDMDEQGVRVRIEKIIADLDLPADREPCS